MTVGGEEFNRSLKYRGRTGTIISAFSCPGEHHEEKSNIATGEPCATLLMLMPEPY
jgi:hypothetical protein